MNAFSASPPAITRSPMSGPEQAMENIDQTAQATTSRPISQREEATGNSVETIVRASQAEQTSNDDSLMQTLDWPLPATRWIPRPRPAQATSNPSHRLCRVNKNGEWEIQQPWEHDHAHEPQLCLTQTSPLSAERPQLDYDEIQAPIVFELTVPALKYHEHLECITHPRLTQQEYERRVFAGENTSDANVSILCSGDGNTIKKLIEINRGALMKASEMFPILLSNHYLQGCQMLFLFPRDPHVCFYLVKKYLEDGPHRFTKAVLKEWMELQYGALNRFIVYIRLCRLTSKLGVPPLMRMAYEIMVDYDHTITGPYCIELAKLIFLRRTSSRDAGLMEAWCFKHIRANFHQLDHSQEWKRLLPYLVGTFQRRWRKLVWSNRILLAPIEEESEPRAEEVRQDGGGDEDEYDEFGPTPTPPRGSGNLSKAFNVLGIDNQANRW